MEEKLRGIVLGGVNYGENDKILTVFTLEKGTVSARIKGVKKAGAKLKFASEPFCFAEFIFLTTKDKRTVVGASLIDSFYSIREDITRFFCASTCVEFVKRFAKEEIISPEMFLLLANVLKELAYGNENSKSVLLKFLIKALKLSGYALNIGACARCGEKIVGRPFFAYELGSFYCEECNEKGKEIKISTLKGLLNAQEGKVVDEELSLGALRLIDYYITNKTEENLNSLKELLRE